jgi:hypothetical protein
MNFDKNETYILKHLSLYKNTSIFIMVGSALAFIYPGLYIIIFKEPTGRDYSLTAAAIVMLTCGYLMFCYIKIIEKFMRRYQLNDKDKDT